MSFRQIFATAISLVTIVTAGTVPFAEQPANNCSMRAGRTAPTDTPRIDAFRSLQTAQQHR